MHIGTQGFASHIQTLGVCGYAASLRLTLSTPFVFDLAVISQDLEHSVVRLTS